MPTPDQSHQTETITETKLAIPWQLVVHNDPVTLMSYVTMVFQRLFGYSFSEAYRMMMEVHTDGRSIVWSGAREQAEIYLHKLHAAQLLATMEPVGE